MDSIVQVERDCKIIPFFAPADNTQVIILHPSQNMFRIWEHEVLPTGDISMKRVIKYSLPDMSDRPNFKTCHTALSTDNNEYLIMVDKVDMHVFKLSEAKAHPPPQDGKRPQAGF